MSNRPPHREPRGWFADTDIDEQPHGDYPWQPCLQLDGTVQHFDMWFRTKAECERFICDEIIPAAGHHIDDPREAL